MRFVDLFAGLGGFRLALTRLGMECVFASEIDPELRVLYSRNFPDAADLILGDIRTAIDKVPPHDILCAGFPCQPFSKSGTQRGTADPTHGTLFHEILVILKNHHPQYVILENVGNFERHDGGRTWQIVKQGLQSLGYSVRGSQHLRSGGPGLISPHDFGFPQSRGRFFIVARLGELPDNPFPAPIRSFRLTLDEICQRDGELTEADRLETRLSDRQITCINTWTRLLSSLPSDKSAIPSFPLWTDEFGATYPYERRTPFASPLSALRKSLDGRAPNAHCRRDALMQLLPSYARSETREFPVWKVRFIHSNREWYTHYRAYVPPEWLASIRQLPSSMRKLEWNCRGGDRDLWTHVLQFRPSGLRVRRPDTSPALVAMTSTQTPILGPSRRYITRVEGLRLQAFPDSFSLPASREKAFEALGNAVHVAVAELVAASLLRLPQHHAPAEGS